MRSYPKRLVLLNIGLLLVILAAIVATTVFVSGVVEDKNIQAREERAKARYVFCLEVEKLKRIQVEDERGSTTQLRAILKANPDGIPGVSREQIEALIQNNYETIEDLQPIPMGCVNFARDPGGLNVKVPEIGGQ